ncbi:hypothetical protein CPAST_c18350 [Clostridium pasteurianum DSM 525 = ATCC 6013]|uniref:Uncharacterized protein n=1 Tax=Clostridium pasteurianum DSM 525 = ATCC 6013 TaxID=1262449 RepID=A0A0H3J9R0_CLOPA|nr:hypothetical protein [Clostridium pasteurianum]AJA47905.1 hypothetical protein CPAST_c18350 [Clostridium pasteurianum DSM 525 = ATCC 6013]AJA51893.1 hypothetical protein CLPA_c18350 [Clostridium pasteurianum DSM 525 = ATCC 6013]AOZ75195.1 hypothetical protein AQ983_08910 [Clostridium pasteurianum DSM 525 = ATCC 6013]AOZ78990.1 hypothetical protein AQ984_08900 [Clostridium pasteurianum]ELP59808.1 hypothetical protein F502_08083 [Clostridium pasteurianum DSM 525 = ATCC 6013]
MTTVLLLIIGILLIGVNIRAMRKDKSSFKNAFDNASTNIKDYDLEIGKLRKEFAETIMELQNEIENLKDRLEEKSDIQKDNVHNFKIDNSLESSLLENNKLDVIEIQSTENGAVEEKKIDYKENYATQNAYLDNREINNVKIDDIERLMKEGLSIDSISEKLGIGKGEILLIKKLYIK